jgi:hypothetical protein
MAITKVRGQLLTGVDDNATASSIVINSDGVVTKPFQPSCRAIGTGAWLTITQTTVLPFNAAAHDSGSHFDTSTYEFTCPVAGSYLFTASVYGRLKTGYTGDNANWWGLMPHRNGSAITSTNIMGYQNAGDSDSTATFTTVVFCNASDTLSLSVRVSSGAQAEIYQAHMNLSIDLLS